MQNLINLKKHWYIILIVAAIFALTSFTISKFQTPQYESTVQLLIIQKYGVQFDAFTAKRSAETVGETMSKVIYTSSFMNQTLSAPLDINDTFSQDPKKRKEEWKKDINVRLLESGNLEIAVYQEDRNQTEQLAYGIAYTMVTKGSQYHGGAQQVEIKMIEKPITSAKPVKPKTLLNTIIGALAGLLSTLGIMLLLPEKKKKNQAKKIIIEQDNSSTINQPVRTIEPLRKKIVKHTEARKNKKKYTGEEYSQEKVDEWIKSGKFKPR